jgi:hypothetical protein
MGVGKEGEVCATRAGDGRALAAVDDGPDEGASCRAAAGSLPSCFRAGEDGEFAPEAEEAPCVAGKTEDRDDLLACKGSGCIEFLGGPRISKVNASSTKPTTMTPQKRPSARPARLKRRGV